MTDRISFGFHNPNHAAALVCALLPLCFGWRWVAWVGRGLAEEFGTEQPDQLLV